MSSQAGWDSVTGIVTLLLDGNLIAIAVAILIAFGVPIALHIIFYRSAASPPSSNFLLLGPSGAGKTAFATLVGLIFLVFSGNTLADDANSSKPSPRRLPKNHTSHIPPRRRL